MKYKKVFGITGILVSAIVLGLLGTALLHMRTGNHEALLRIRGRDGAIEVAQQVIDSLNRIGLASIPDPSTVEGDALNDDGDFVWEWGTVSSATIDYTPTVKVSPVADLRAKKEPSAKQVNVEVSWQFKGSTQSINMSTVIR